MEHEFHRELKAAVKAAAIINAYDVFEERLLPNLTRPDLILMNRHGIIIIVEIKCTLQSRDIISTHSKYNAYCNALYIAIPHAELRYSDSNNHPLQWATYPPTVGILTINRDRVSQERQAAHRLLTVDVFNKVVTSVNAFKNNAPYHARARDCSASPTP